MVSAKTGLSEEMSQTAVEVVMDYLKAKLPPPIAAQVGAVLDGAGGGSAAGGVVSKGLGGLFGT